MIWKNLIATMLLSLCSLFANATPAEPLSTAEHNKLVPSRICIDVATKNANAQIITKQQLDASIALCVADAKVVLGRDISATDIIQKVKTGEERTAAEKFGGLLDGINWVRAGFGLLIVVFAGIVIGVTLPLWMSLPKEMYALAMFGGALSLAWFGLTRATDNAVWGLMSALAWIGAQIYVAHAWKLKGNPSTFFLIATVYSAIIAFLFHSSLIGYVPIITLMCAAGFAAQAFGWGFALGFSDDKSVSIGTIAAFLILGLYVFGRITGYDDPYIQIFAPAAYLVGSFVGFLGLLILASRPYSWGGSSTLTGKYLFSNFVLMPVFGIGAVFVGYTYGIPELQKVGGTFFALWAVEKYVEWTFRGITSVSVFGLVGSVGGFYLLGVLRDHAEKVGPYLFFV